MKKYKYVYVAGPYAKPDPVTNTRNAVMVAEKLVDIGLIPFVPHLTHLWHLISPHEVNYWLGYDIWWLKQCEVLVRIVGDSDGADKEVVLALELGLPIFYVEVGDTLDIISENGMTFATLERMARGRWAV